MDETMPVTHLASAVWNEQNDKITRPVPPVPKSVIQSDKLQIYLLVASVCQPVVAAVRRKLAAEKRWGAAIR